MGLSGPEMEGRPVQGGCQPYALSCPEGLPPPVTLERAGWKIRILFLFNNKNNLG